MGRKSNAAIEAEKLANAENDVQDNVENKLPVDVDEKTASSGNKYATRNSVKIDDSEEIEVESIIPHVSYLDKRTDDMYEWDEVGHVEIMTFEAIKDMWRNHKSYFKNLWLKPNDERVLIKLGIKKFYDDYAVLLDKSNYTSKNVDKIFSIIAEIPNSMKFSVIIMIKQLIADHDVTDVYVIRKLEQKLGVDFSIIS